MAARAVFAWAVLAMVASVIIERGNGHATLNAAQPDDFVFGLMLLALAFAGLIVVLRGGGTARAGWLLLAVGAGASADFLAHALAVAGLAGGNHGAGVQALVWLATWLLAPAISLLLFVPAIWPSGRVDSGWLRWFTPAAVAAAGALTLALAFAPGHLTGVGPALRPVPNPLGIPGTAGAASLVTVVALLVMTGYTVAALTDLIFRYRKGDAGLRSELRPLVWVVAALPVALAAGWLFGLVLNGRPAVGVYVGGWFVLLGGMAASLLIAQRAARRRDQAVALRRSSVEAAAAERGRLRRELHDGLGASLAALRLQLDAVRTALPLAAGEASVRLGRVEATLASALEELRRIVDGLRPVALDELGLPGALNIQGRALNAAGTAPTVEVIVDPAVPDLPDAVAVALLRISAEALTNAVRHAASSHCTVRLGWQDPVAVLRVEDDGTGMVPARIGHGLATMRERAEELGGTLTVLPASPQGTVVTAVIPSAL